MTHQIKFKSGQPLDLVATKNFTLGGANLSFYKGQEVEFDGSMATIDGETRSLPQLRGAVKAGWLVEMVNYDEDAPEVRPSAQIQVRHPTKGGDPNRPPERTPIVTVESDERVVGNTTAQAAATQANNRNYHGQRAASRNLPPGVEDQDGVVVRAIKTPARQRSELSGNNAGQLLSAAQAPVIEPVRGITQDELLERMSEDERETYQARLSANRARYEDDIQRAGGDRRSVAKVKKAAAPVTREGVTVGVTTGGGIETEDIHDPTAKQRVEVVEREGVKFVQTNIAPDRDQPHPRDPAPVVSANDPRRMIARTLCPDFPDNYAFDVPAKRRMARLQADYADRQDVVRAAYAAETDEGKALIVTEFPEHFGNG
jgi:hypothetical protein